MAKNTKKSSQIELKDVTSSPYFTIAIMVAVCLAVVAVIVLLVMSINNTKAEIVEARQLYQQNVKEVALLEELKVQSEAAEEKLAACENVLPEKLGDVYVLQEQVIDICQGFGLDVTTCEFTVVKNETQEVVFNMAVTGSYIELYEYMKYYTNLEQVHRFDAVNLTRTDDENYTATFSLAFLSEQGAEGAVAAVVDEAVDQLTETTEAAS